MRAIIWISSILLFSLISCGTNNSKEQIEQQTIPEESIKQPIIKKYDGEVIPVNSAYIAQLTELKKTSEKWDSEFIDKIISTINSFENRNADTTILTIGNIDGIGKLDTIRTHVYIKSDSVYMTSKWLRNGIQLWMDKITNPYMWINDSDEFDYEARNIWVTFTIAINYSLPELDNEGRYSSIGNQTASKFGYSELKQQGVQISEQEYLDYLANFKGLVLSYGQPEPHPNLVVWHEPTKQFLTYYAP